MSTPDTDFTFRPAPKARQTDILFDRATYTAFPHVVRLEGEELLMGFRQAPREQRIRHTHPRSIITVIRSKDLGESWAIDEASQLGAGGGQEFSLIHLGKGKVGGLLAMHEVVLAKESERTGIPCRHAHEHAYGNTGAYWCWSRNFGLTWRLHDAVLIDSNIQPSAPPIKLRDGTLLAPAYGMRGRGKAYTSLLYRSEDRGATWSEAQAVAKGTGATRGYGETALLELDRGHVLAMHRIEQVTVGVRGYFWMNESLDGGRNWSKPRPTNILSGACPRLVTLHDGRVLLTYGRRFEPYGIYANLSEDGGRTWSEAILVRKAPNGDQGYTSSLELEPGRIFTTSYAQNRRGVTGIIGTSWALP